VQQIKGFKIQREGFDDVKHEFDSLVIKNWEDTGLKKYGLNLNPDWTAYEVMNQAGLIGVYTVRKDTDLVGYLVVLARAHPHYKDHVFASNDILFIDKEHRKGLLGYFLIKYVVEDLEKLGVSVLLFNTTVEKPYDPILKRLGFDLTEKLYMKFLGD
jgi:GNAT superfamily N-acetyltransferase